MRRSNLSLADTVLNLENAGDSDSGDDTENERVDQTDDGSSTSSEEQDEKEDLLEQLQDLHKRLAKVRSSVCMDNFRDVGPGGGQDAQADYDFGAGEFSDLNSQNRNSQNRLMEGRNKLIVCAVRKPVLMTKSKQGDGWEYRVSMSGFKASMDYIKRRSTVQWVTWPGAFIEEGSREGVRKRMENDYSCSPVFMGKEVMAAFETFCTDVLSPIIHGMTSEFNQKLLEQNVKMFDAYTYINQLFLDKIGDIYEEGDLVLVYDYQLMLLPALLRKRFPDITCGFFLHCPFPSSEIYRTLPEREQFLNGILGADLIAFNHFDYVRHFLNACTLFLGLESLPSKIEYNGRIINIEICPAGIDLSWFQEITSKLNPNSEGGGIYGGGGSYRELSNTLKPMDRHCQSDPSFATNPVEFETDDKPEELKIAERLAERFKRNGRKLLVSLVELDWCKGIPQAVFALETLFREWPHWRGKVTLFLVVRDPDGKKDPELRKIVNRLIGTVNGKYGRCDYTPVHYMKSALTRPQLIALYSIADVALVTSTREGINMGAMEFIACQSALLFDTSDDYLAPYVTSSSPPDDTAPGLRERGRLSSLGSVPRKSRSQRQSPSSRTSRTSDPGVLIYSEFAGCASSFKGALVVNPFDAHQVAETINTALKLSAQSKSLRYHQLERYVSHYTSEFWAKRMVAALEDARDSAKLFNTLELLDVGYVRSFYERCTTLRLLVLDYDGTLMAHQPIAQLAQPSQVVLDTLEALCRDPCNLVYVITGRTRHDLEEWFGRIPRLGLIAEFGFWCKLINGPDSVYDTMAAGSPSTHPAAVTSLRDRNRISHSQSLGSQAWMGGIGNNLNFPPLLELPHAHSLNDVVSLQQQQQTKDHNNNNNNNNKEELVPNPQCPDSSTASVAGHDNIAQSSSQTRFSPHPETPSQTATTTTRPRPILWTPQSGQPITSEDASEASPASRGGSTPVLNAFEAEPQSRKEASAEEKPGELLSASWSQPFGSSNDLDLSWREQVISILEDVTNCTPGSVLEVMECCLMWHFRDTDVLFGEFAARNLQHHLVGILRKRQVRVMVEYTHKIMVVQPSRVNKGRALDLILNHMRKTSNKSKISNPELFFVIGDERTDEDMFYAVNNVDRQLHGADAGSGSHVFTVKVGRHPSRARYYVEDHEAVLNTLQAMASVSKDSLKASDAASREHLDLPSRRASLDESTSMFDFSTVSSSDNFAEHPVSRRASLDDFSQFEG